MRLHDIKPNPGAKHRRKRLGSGESSGLGKTCGRGHKGQKSRSGVSIKGFEGGQMPLHRRLPKRGFKNPFRREFSIVNFADIDKAIVNKKINPTKEISQNELIKAGLIRKKNLGVKLLANGKLTQKITIKVNKASKQAKEQLSKINGILILEDKKEKDSAIKQEPKKKEK